MHDPMVVAFEIRRPWPQRSNYGGNSNGKRWSWRRGSPFLTAFGRAWYFPSMVTVWHVEPDGHDSGEVCKHWRRVGERSVPSRAWRWHVWHWHVQVALAQKVKRFLFERCIECGRRFPWGYSPVSHSWDGPGARWFRINKLSYHGECSSLVGLRQSRTTDERLIRQLFAAYRLGVDQGEVEALTRLTDPRQRTMEFADAYRLSGLLGYKRDDDYAFVPSPSTSPVQEGSDHE